MQFQPIPTFEIDSNLFSIFEKGIVVYGRINQQNLLDGPCRVQFQQHHILEGVFNQGISKKAVMLDRYAGSWVVGRFSNGSINDKSAEIYNHKGLLVYMGSVHNGVRHGPGTQYFPQDEERSFKGEWFCDMAMGYFYEMINSNQILKGKYLFNRKEGDFIYTCNNKSSTHYFKDNEISNPFCVKDLDFRIQKGREQILQSSKSRIGTCLNQITHKALKDIYPINRYGYLLQQQQIENTKNSSIMMDTSVVSMYSQQLIRCMRVYKRIYNVYISGTDLIENYSGLYYQYRNYKNVSDKTNHMHNNFSIVAGYYSTLMFPVCHGNHFVLGVVKIKKDPELQFSFYYYDSLHGSGTKLASVIRDYLLEQLQNKYNLSDKQQIKQKILQMKSIRVKNPRQQDGVSCGVFICMFMYELSIGDNINICVKFDSRQISRFRQKIIDMLTNQINPFIEKPQQQLKKQATRIDLITQQSKLYKLKCSSRILNFKKRVKKD